jgi:hypothetical protein
VEHDWPSQDKLGGKDDGCTKVHGSNISEEHGEVAWMDMER